MTTTSVQKLTSAETRRAIPGTVFNVILTGAATNNHVFIAEIQSVPGSELPRHVHTREDEMAIIKKGALTYFMVMISLMQQQEIRYCCQRIFLIILLSLHKKQHSYWLLPLLILAIFSASYLCHTAAMISLLRSVRRKKK